MMNAGNAGGQLDLDLDGARLEPEISDGGDGRDHQAPSPATHATLSKHPPSSARATLDRGATDRQAPLPSAARCPHARP